MQQKFRESVSNEVIPFLKSRIELNQKTVISKCYDCEKEYYLEEYYKLIALKLKNSKDCDIKDLELSENHDYYFDISDSSHKYLYALKKLSNFSFANSLLSQAEIDNLLLYVKKAILEGGIGEDAFILNESEFVKKLLLFLLNNKTLNTNELIEIEKWLQFFNISKYTFFDKKTESKLILDKTGNFLISTQDRHYLSIVNSCGKIVKKYSIKYEIFHHINDLYCGYIGKQGKRILWIFKKVGEEFIINDFSRFCDNCKFNFNEESELIIFQNLEDFLEENDLEEFFEFIYHNDELVKIQKILEYGLKNMDLQNNRILYYKHKK